MMYNYLTKGGTIMAYYGTLKEFEAFLKENNLKEWGYPNGK